MATIYGIVKQSGGDIQVYSEAGQGTVFKIYFPRCEEKTKALPAENAENALPGGTETILLVEDEDIVRKLTREVLEMCGYQVIEAAIGADAIALCRKSGIDLLITDVVMPEMGGRSLAERLLIECPGMRVLFMSGYTDDAIVHHGIIDEDVNFIQKPFTPEDLAQKVREVLDAAADD